MIALLKIAMKYLPATIPDAAGSHWRLQVCMLALSSNQSLWYKPFVVTFPCNMVSVVVIPLTSQSLRHAVCDPSIVVSHCVSSLLFSIPVLGFGTFPKGGCLTRD